jgi:uncharacterized protein YaaN involved in tellurite resistance
MGGEDMKVHANRYDTIRTWCDADDSYAEGAEISGSSSPEAEDLATVTCRACLDGIMKYGSAAMARSLDLADAMIAQMKAARP